MASKCIELALQHHHQCQPQMIAIYNSKSQRLKTVVNFWCWIKQSSLIPFCETCKRSQISKCFQHRNANPWSRCHIHEVRFFLVGWGVILQVHPHCPVLCWLHLFGQVPNASEILDVVIFLPEMGVHIYKNLNMWFFHQGSIKAVI